MRKATKALSIPPPPLSLSPLSVSPLPPSLSLPHRYISLDSNGCIELCGGRELGDKYLQKLVSCMETVFREKNNVVTALVADVNQYVYKNAGGCTVYMYMYIYMHVVYMYVCRYFTLQMCMLHAVCVFVELI